MSTRRHKRRRIDTDSDTVDLQASPLPNLSAQHASHLKDTQMDDLDPEASPKEREVWDAFREEHYELLEQLPISIHRDFTLIRELDQQAQELTSSLSPTILKYIALRKSLAASNKTSQPLPTGHTDGLNGSLNADGSVNLPSTLPNGNTADGETHSASKVPSSIALSNNQGRVFARSGPPSTLVDSSQSTRDLLTSMAQSVEEISRASIEKQYLAQHVCDLVDRYIRDLDRSIKEQEASISLGLRPGTHPASIILPELVVPQFKRTRAAASPPPLEVDVVDEPLGIEIAVEPHNQARETQGTVEEPPPSPLPGEAETEDVEIIDANAEPAEELATETVIRVKKKGRRRRKFSKPKAQRAAESTSSVPADGNDIPPSQPPLTLKIPAQSQAAAAPALLEDAPDPDEPRYCFCNQVSFGDMIACDNPTCAREWFHMGCVGLVRPPKGKWYCRDCIEFVKKPKGKRRAR